MEGKGIIGSGRECKEQKGRERKGPRLQSGRRNQKQKGAKWRKHIVKKNTNIKNN